MAKKTPKVMLAVNQEPTAKRQQTTENGQQSTDNGQQSTDKSQEPTDACPCPDTYDGLPLKEIMERLIEGMGIYGSPKRGVNRNNTLYKLALQMMPCVDHNLNHLLALLPDWGLPYEERRSTIASALSCQSTEKPTLLRSVLNLMKQEAQENPNPLDPSQLPKLLATIGGLFGRNKMVAILGALPILGALMTWVRAEYRDGTLELPIFHTVVIGHFASGKSMINRLSDMLASPLYRHDEQTERERQEHKYTERLAKGLKEAPGMRDFSFRTVPAKSTAPALLERASQNNGQILFSLTDEISTLVTARGKFLYGKDALCKGFDGHGRWGQGTFSAQSCTGEVSLRLNYLWGGTDEAVQRLYGNPEDGLYSRIIPVHMDDLRGQKIQRISRADKRVEGIRKKAEELYERYSERGETLELDLTKVNEALDHWDEQKIEDFWQSGNVAIDDIRKRAALYGFRAGMVAAVLEGCRVTKKVTYFALWVAEEVFRLQIAQFGAALTELDRRNERVRMDAQREVRRTSKNTRILATLPETFSKADLIREREKHGDYGECASILTRWKQGGRVRYDKDSGLYHKLS